MIRKYHNYKPQTNPWHHKEGPHNHHETPGRQTKHSKQLSLLHQDDCKTRTDTKQRATKHRTITDSHKRSKNKQNVNNNRTNRPEMDNSPSHQGEGLKCTHWHKSQPQTLLLLKHNKCPVCTEAPQPMQRTTMEKNSN